MAAVLAIISAMLFALAAALQQRGQFVLTRPAWHVAVAGAALLAALAGATIITLGNRETQIPGEAAPDDRPRSDPAPA